ncbi:hypothetical protein LN042_24150 [Kitasatospora sp. RB6PN24]|uniref:hypothetical protein n=1 Tax=Kitasatospora humi TaxID=2893891 RepID=UPI001E646F45|nr:hypothetical protein [Kitasatospora humi]MCC9310122.1 hypothetical protein [Kitasatospora humi]
MSDATSPIDAAPTYVFRHPALTTAATLTALVATIFALLDFFAHGLWPTVEHTAVGLVTFTAVRIVVGLALTMPSLAKSGTEATKTAHAGTWGSAPAA